MLVCLRARRPKRSSLCTAASALAGFESRFEKHERARPRIRIELPLLAGDPHDLMDLTPLSQRLV